MSEATDATRNTAATTARLQLAEGVIDLPVVTGSEQEHGIDITALRGETGYITLYSGFANRSAERRVG